MAPVNVTAPSIGIFDSGVGGLTVVKEIIKMHPEYNIIYFGDTARLPYGPKSPDTILRYAREIICYLQSHNVSSIVIACNTATAFALEKLQKEVSCPLIGVVSPGAKKAAASSSNGRIGVLATKGTVASDIYKKEIQSHRPEATVFQVACPLFVPLIEEGLTEHPATQMIIKEYLDSLKKEKPDTILLGCTHYPLLMEHLQKFFGPETHIINSAETCAMELKKFPDKKNTIMTKPKYTFYVSDSPEDFLKSSRRFLGIEIPEVLKHII